jgi:hypothetical protein
VAAESTARFDPITRARDPAQAACSSHVVQSQRF